MSQGSIKNDSSSIEELEKIQTQQETTRSLDPKTNQLEKSRGVERIELVKDSLDNAGKTKTMKWLFFISIFICSWARALDSSTTYTYQAYLTSSFDHHSMLSTVQIATSIISAVSKPFLAKISDITSRPFSYCFVLVFYVLGYIIIASSRTISAYIVGAVFQAIGGSGVDLLNTVVIGDMTPLQHRGLMQAVIGSPYIINVWFSGLITNDLAASNWRWGYGMFAIIMPLSLLPAFAIMFYLDHEANKNKAPVPAEEKKPWLKILYDALIEIDAFGLIIMGFGWSLLLLPFSLYSSADNQWKNPSLIAMFIVGGLLLFFYAGYEIWLAPFPSLPKRVVFNKTFICAVIIDFFYELGGYIRILYLSSYALVVTNWSTRNYTYYLNTLTMSLCVFAFLAGALQRYFHRYKYIQIVGICILIIGNGIIIRNHSAAIDTATLVMVQVLCGFGGSFSVIGSQVSSQLSVPHQDMSLVISLLSLWTSIGAAIGSAIAAPIWSSKLPKYLRQFMPSSVTDEEVTLYFGSTTLIISEPYDSEIRQAAIEAYQHTSYYMYCIGLGLYFIPLIAACFQTNYYLGDEQNAIEGVQNAEHNKHKSDEEVQEDTVIASSDDEIVSEVKN